MKPVPAPLELKPDLEQVDRRFKACCCGSPAIRDLELYDLP